jgi:hypothetical protein
VQSDGPTPDSEDAQRIRDHIRNRLQALGERQRAKRQINPLRSGGDSINTDQEDGGSDGVGNA